MGRPHLSSMATRRKGRFNPRRYREKVIKRCVLLGSTRAATFRSRITRRTVRRWMQKLGIPRNPLNRSLSLAEALDLIAKAGETQTLPAGLTAAQLAAVVAHVGALANHPLLCKLVARAVRRRRKVCAVL